MSLLQHKIYKFIRSGGSTDYTCYTCNTSYSTKKSLAEDHPELEEMMIIIQDKRTEELQIKLNQAFANDKSHVKRLSEN